MSSKGLSGRIKLSSYDDMFSAENDGDTAVEAKPADGQIVELPLSELHTFENHFVLWMMKIWKRWWRV